MPRAVQLPDGRILRSEKEVNPQAFDQMRPLIEMGASLPKGWSVEDPPTEPGVPEYRGLRKGAMAVRDTATQGVAGLLGGMAAGPQPEDIGMAARPELGMGWPTASPEELQAAAPVTQGAANFVARNMVPQTPGQAVHMAATAMMGGVGGAVGTFGRGLLPAMLGVMVDAGTTGEVNPLDVTTQIVASVVGEGIVPAISRVTRLKAFQKARDKIGNQWAAEMGGTLDAITSVKGLNTPERIRKMIASPEGPWDTLYHKAARDNIEDAESKIVAQINPGMAMLPPGRQGATLAMLESVAGVNPVMAGQAGTNVGRNPPDVLFNMAIQKVREQRQLMASLEGAEKHAAGQEYGKLRGQLEAALGSIDPGLAQQYDRMNRQYTADMDVEKLLWRMYKADGFSTDAEGTHLQPAAVAQVWQDSMALVEKTGFLGGADDTLKFLAGPNAVAGARPTLHEGYARLFQSGIGLPVAVSLPVQGQMLNMPPNTPITGHVRGMADILGATALRGMGSSIMPKEGE